MRKYIIYYGVCFLPDKNAMCRRAFAMSELIKKSGFVPTIIGFDQEDSADEIIYKGVECYKIKYPQTTIEWFDDMKSISKIKKIISKIGISNVYAVIASDLKFLQIVKMKRFCEKNSIQYIPDVLDWYGRSQEINIKNIFRDINTSLTMNIIYFHFKKMIVVSKKLQKRFQSTKTKCLRIPMTYLEKKNDSFMLKNTSNSCLKFIFCGKAGNRFEKEKLDWIIKSFSCIKEEYRLYILGTTKEEIINNAPYLESYFTENMFFLGICSHRETIEVLRECDFNLLIREKNRLSEYGFSTKLMESFEYRIPLVATKTGDNCDYIRNGYNGFICEATESEFINMIKTIFLYNVNDLKKMKLNMDIDDLNNDNYIYEFEKLIK